jgi:hypothetical protein
MKEYTPLQLTKYHFQRNYHFAVIKAVGEFGYTEAFE